MFQGLRVGSKLYVFNRNEVALAIGEVVNCNQVPQFPNITPNNWAQMPTMTVDIVARVDGQEYTYPKIPANQVIADVQGTALVISENREAIIDEIENCRKQDERELELVPHRQQRVARCKEIIADLNPQIKIDEQRERELKDLQNQVGKLTEMLTEVLEMKKASAAALKTSNKKTE